MKSEPGQTLIEHLAAFAGDLRLGDLPPVVIEQAKLCILDTVGCMVAGSRLPDGAAFLEAEKAICAPGEASVLGTDVRLPMEGAARMNGYNGDVLELNDLIGGHASIGCVTAALATGEALRLDGRQLLRCIIAGIEVTARVNLGYRRSNGGQDTKPASEVGIASPGIPNTIGSGVVAALAMGLTPQQVAASMAIAGTLAGWSPMEVLSRGGSIKPSIMGAWPASVGIMAARYARAGVTGPDRLLESDVGYYATVARAYDADIVRGSLGWQLENPSRKWHACCGCNHAAIDGISSLLRDHGPLLFDDATVEVGLIDYAADMMALDTPPESVDAARFDLKYCVALAMNGHDHILPEHCLDYERHLRDPAVVGAMARIKVSKAPDIDHFSKCRISVAGPEGRRAILKVDAPKGSPGNPMSKDEVIAKFMQLAGDAVRDPRRFVARVMALELEADVASLAADLAPAGR